MNIESFPLTLPFISLIGGLIFLIAGGEFLVAGSIKIATKIKMNPLLVGLTVVAFGTSMPEFFVSISATLEGSPNIMLGNVVGSNIANIGLVLAISAIIMPLSVKYHHLKLELWAVLGAGALLAGLTWFGFFHRLTGFLFIGLLAFYTWYSYSHSKHACEDQEGCDEINTTKSITFIIIGLVALAGGSNFFINGAVTIATHFGVSELIIGLTMAAVGTSLPELASCISAIRHNETELLVGNIIGSNLFNLLMVLGGTATIIPFALPQNLLTRDLPVMMAFAIFLTITLAIKQKISRLLGVSLFTSYCLYMFVLL